MLEGKLPPKGSVLAPDVALCDQCPRKASKPADLSFTEFKRPHQVVLDPNLCLLAQGIVCMGPATRGGCEALCPAGNMPCTGCFGPTSRVRDQGAKILSSLCANIASKDEKEIRDILAGIPDPVGTFYRYGLAKSLLRRKVSLPVEPAKEAHEPRNRPKFGIEASARANAAAHAQRRRVTIDPITRLEGHGKIDIFLDDQGDVERAYLQIPELRGFEVFSLGRPAEEMPQITSRICGVCPTAHHMAATKALDDLYQVEPPPAARKIRELVYNTFMVEDHALHVYILGGPDFIVGPQAPPEQRNVVGVIHCSI